VKRTKLLAAGVLLGCIQACGGRATDPSGSGAGAEAGTSAGGAPSAATAGANATGGTNAAGGANATGGTNAAGDSNAAGTTATGPEGTLILERRIDWLWVDESRFFWLAYPDRFEGCQKLDCAHTIVSYAGADQFPLQDRSVPAVGGGQVYWTS
jgi:hypothetical protein